MTTAGLRVATSLSASAPVVATATRCCRAWSAALSARTMAGSSSTTRMSSRRVICGFGQGEAEAGAAARRVDRPRSDRRGPRRWPCRWPGRCRWRSCPRLGGRARRSAGALKEAPRSPRRRPTPRRSRLVSRPPIRMVELGGAWRAAFSKQVAHDLGELGVVAVDQRQRRKLDLHPALARAAARAA